jgi:hypothetical protein
MSSHRDPPRLRALADHTDGALAAALDDMAREEPTFEQLGGVAAKARLALGLPPTIGPSAHPHPASSGTAPVAAPSTGAKGIFSAAHWIQQIVIPMGIGALGAVAIEVARAPSPVAAPPAPSVWIAPPSGVADHELATRTTQPTASATAIASHAEQPGSEPVAVVPLAVPSPRRGVRTMPDRHPAMDESTAPPSPPSVPDSATTEISIVTSAHRAMANDPRLALELAQQHELRYPSGALVQEREVIAIQALIQLARRAEAEARAARFRSRFAGSAHARRIDVLLSEDAKLHR